MVLLTMTDSIVDCLQRASHMDGGVERETKSITNPPGDNESSLDDPAVGKPISHVQIIDLWQQFQKTSSHNDGALVSLESLLVGAKVYVPPLPPQLEPTDEYKALMARLRHEEETRIYKHMLNPPEFHSSSATLASSSSGLPSDLKNDYEDEVTLQDVHRQVMLIFNFVLTMGGVAYGLWVLARWWPTPSRLFLSMGGCLLAGAAEYGLYAGYVWHLSDAKLQDAKNKKNNPTVSDKKVKRSWVVQQQKASQQETIKSLQQKVNSRNKNETRKSTAKTAMGLPEVGRKDFASGPANMTRRK